MANNAQLQTGLDARHARVLALQPEVLTRAQDAQKALEAIEVNMLDENEETFTTAFEAVNELVAVLQGTSMKRLFVDAVYNSFVAGEIALDK